MDNAATPTDHKQLENIAKEIIQAIADILPPQKDKLNLWVDHNRQLYSFRFNWREGKERTLSFGYDYLKKYSQSDQLGKVACQQKIKGKIQHAYTNDLSANEILVTTTNS